MRRDGIRAEVALSRRQRTLQYVAIIACLGMATACGDAERPPEVAAVAEVPAQDAPVAAVMLLQGQVSIVSPDGTKAEAALGDMLTREHGVQTAAGSAVILHLNNNHLMRIDEEIELFVRDITLLNEPEIDLDAKTQLASLIEPEERSDLDGLDQAEELAGWHSRIAAGVTPSAGEEDPAEAPEPEPIQPNRPRSAGAKRSAPAKEPKPTDPGLQIIRGGAPRHPSDGDVGAPTMTAPEPSAPVTCDDLTALEPDAMMGRLTDAQFVCLESEYAQDRERKKVSLLLLANAWSSGDKRTWQKLMRRHLAEVDDTDANLHYKYALYFSKKGAKGSESCIRSADNALQRKTTWTGDVLTSRVYSLYTLRAECAQNLWEADVQAGSDASASKARTLDYALEWIAISGELGKDPDKAIKLCNELDGGDRCQAN